MNTYKRVSVKNNREDIFSEMLHNGSFAAAIAAMMISRGCMLSVMAPLGLAWFAACGGGMPIFVGCVIGTIFMGMGAVKIKYLVMLCIYRLYLNVSKKEHTTVFNASVMALTAFGVSLIVNIFRGNYIYDIVMSIFEALTVWAAVSIFDGAASVIKRGGQVINDEETISLAIMAGAAVSGLQGISIFMIKPANILSMYIILFTAYKGGVGVSGAAGAALGIITAMSQGDTPALTGVYAFVGLTAGVINMFGKIGVVLAAVFANSVFSAYYSSSTLVLINAAEIAAAGIAFYFTPESFLCFIEKMTIKMPPYNIARGYMLRMKLQADEAFSEIKTALCGMARAFDITSEEEKNAGIICERASARVCEKCNLKKYCWNKNFSGTAGMFKKIIELIREGRENESIEIISGRCVKGELLYANIIDLCAIVSREEALENKSRKYMGGAIKQWDKLIAKVEQRRSKIRCPEKGCEMSAVAINRALGLMGIMKNDVDVFKNSNGLYSVIIKSDKEIMFDVTLPVEDVLSRAMSVISEEHTAEGYITVLGETPFYEAEIGIMTMDKPGTEVSGDSCESFSLNNGMLYCVLSDGMGSGTAASKESRNITDIFKNLICGGFSMEEAAEIINLGMINKKGEESCASFDAVSVNLYSGAVTMIKAGAAATVIKSGETKIIRHNSLPLGILDIDKFSVSYDEISGESYIVMMTDGVPDNKDDRESGEEFVRNIVDVSENLSAQNLADNIIVSSVADKMPKDDMMTVVIKIYPRQIY